MSDYKEAKILVTDYGSLSALSITNLMYIDLRLIMHVYFYQLTQIAYTYRTISKLVQVSLFVHISHSDWGTSEYSLN